MKEGDFMKTEVEYYADIANKAVKTLLNILFSLLPIFPNTIYTITIPHKTKYRSCTYIFNKHKTFAIQYFFPN